MHAALINRKSIGYVVGTLLVMAGVFGYVNIAQQLYTEHFGVSEEAFPMLFGGTAAMMAVANITNSRIVMRFGARRVSHTGIFIFIAVSAVQVWASHYRAGQIEWFLPLMALNLGLLGFLGANFGSIAMQPFARIAGAHRGTQVLAAPEHAAQARRAASVQHRPVEQYRHLRQHRRSRSRRDLGWHHHRKSRWRGDHQRG